jgi:hypothetical protein
MGLKPKFKPSDVRKRGPIIERIFDDYIFEVLSYVGESFVREARGMDTYLDHTGNLRSSIGYLILKHGNIHEKNFEETGQGTDKATGVDRGLEYAKSIGSHARWGFVGVAGMNYATAVESKGYDVITGSSEQTRQLLIRLLKRAKSKMNK